jgi:CheY-like chemotaxis protein
MQPKILLIDDREENHVAIEAILAPDGCQLVRAYSGLEALKILLKEHDFVMILLDVKMPLLSGFETAELIYQREKLRHIPIILITAHNYGDDKGYRAGCIDYILKPISPEVLRAKVAVFLEIYKRNALLFEQVRKLTIANSLLEKEIHGLKASNNKLGLAITNLQIDIIELGSTPRASSFAVSDSKLEEGSVLMICDPCRENHSEKESSDEIVYTQGVPPARLRTPQSTLILCSNSSL